VHREQHAPNTVQMSTLLSIKTGACPEDCAYCPQSVRYDTGLERERLHGGRGSARARHGGARRGRDPLLSWARPGARRRRATSRSSSAMIREVRALGLETCVTLGMLTPAQAQRLADAGLDYYNHNIDTSPEFYGEDHHDPHLRRPARHARQACATPGEDLLRRHRRHGRDACATAPGCCVTLANLLDEHPESVPINLLVQVPGTPLHGADELDPFELRAHDRRRAPDDAGGRWCGSRRDASQMTDELQALAFLAGANSIFYGEKLLTTGNPDVARDRELLRRLGINGQDVEEHDTACAPAFAGAAPQEADAGAARA
jgi:biotin synthase